MIEEREPTATGHDPSGYDNALFESEQGITPTQDSAEILAEIFLEALRWSCS